MALAKQGNKIIAKLTDLSQESSFNNGDRIVFWCNSTGEASTIDYANLRIDLDHTTFSSLFNEVVNFTTSASTWVEKMNESLEDVTDKIDALIEVNTEQTNSIDAVKMLVKMVTGQATLRADGVGNQPENNYVNTLSDGAKIIYNQLKADVLSALGDTGLDFSKHNVINLDDRVTVLEGLNDTIDTLGSRIDAIETSDASQNTELNTLKDTTIPGLTNRIVVLEQSDTTQNNNIKDVTNRLVAVEKSDLNQNNDIVLLKSTTQSQQNELNTLKTTTIKDITDRVLLLEKSDGTQNSDITLLKSQSTTYQNEINTLKQMSSRVEALERTDAQHTSEITDIKTLTNKITTIERSDITQQSDINDLKTRMSRLETNDATHSTDITNLKKLNDRVAALEKTGTDHTNNLDAVKMLVKMLIGLATKKAETEFSKALSQGATTIYNQLKKDVTDASGESALNFTKQNVIGLNTRVTTLEG